MDIKTWYNFCKYVYLKSKVVLLLSLSINTVCFNIGCLITLCNITFFWTQVPDILIWKMVIAIMVRDLGANKCFTNQYAIINLYILAKDIQGQEVIAHIWHKIYLVQ